MMPTDRAAMDCFGLINCETPLAFISWKRVGFNDCFGLNVHIGQAIALE